MRALHPPPLPSRISLIRPGKGSLQGHINLRGASPQRPLLRALIVLLALAAAFAAGRIPLGRSTGNLPSGIEQAAQRAERRMRDIEAWLWEQRLARLQARQQAAGLPTDETLDPRRSGLIGEELSELTTTLGSLDAKRLSTDPAWAGELTRRLYQAGLRRNDLVAAGFSGSFPGLNLALSLACEELGLRLGSIVSTTASTFGANIEGFTWPQMAIMFHEAGLLGTSIIAVTPGGLHDSGAGTVLEALDYPEGRPAEARPSWRIAQDCATHLGVPFLSSETLESAVESRLSTYQSWAGPGKIALFVNIGGSDSNLGEGESGSGSPSGFIPPRSHSTHTEAFHKESPGHPARGVLERMVDQGIPALSLLDIRNLALRWGMGASD